MVANDLSLSIVFISEIDAVGAKRWLKFSVVKILSSEVTDLLSCGYDAHTSEIRSMLELLNQSENIWFLSDSGKFINVVDYLLCLCVRE